MNFGEKLKQLRAEKNWTQPQMAEAIGIEQSYLSKLENDKSVPSAEMFQAIVKALDLDVQEFLKDIDHSVLSGPLKQIPEVANFISQAVATKVHDTKKWLLGAAAACTLGFALILAAREGIFFPKRQYIYLSEGVIFANETDDFFDQFKKLVALKVEAKVFDQEQASKAILEFETTRVHRTEIKIDHDAGPTFIRNVEKGRRRYKMYDISDAVPMPNKVMQWLGAVFVFAGIAAFFIEWRLRRLQTR